LKEIRVTKQFVRDLKQARKRGKDIAKLDAASELLKRGQRLPPRYRQHRLRGEMQGFWECHLEHDWLLVWNETDTFVILVRCGSHADLFE
jgi:mRNA interferase YafQ